MADFFNRNNVAAGSAAVYDEGLRSYMLKVYNYMSAALALTGLVAFFTASNPELLGLFYKVDPTGHAMGFNLLGIIVTFAPLLLVFFLSARLATLSYSAAQTTFWVFAGLMGLSLSSVFLAYTGTSIARVFFITAGTFAGTSLYGYTTRRDLTGMGSFLFMGLIGIILASLVNMFLHSSALNFALSILGVFIFTGLTAYDTQSIKQTYNQFQGEMSGKIAIMGALRLYLDFINIFMYMLRFFGDRR